VQRCREWATDTESHRRSSDCGVALAVPALVTVALVAAVWVSLHAYELIWWREARAERHAMRAQAS
jgi:type II secretory pathway component PulK